MNAKRARPITVASTGPQLLIFPIAAIFSFLFLLLFYFLSIQPAKLQNFDETSASFLKKMP
jgi:hypothetical protein